MERGTDEFPQTAQGIQTRRFVSYRIADVRSRIRSTLLLSRSVIRTEEKYKVYNIPVLDLVCWLLVMAQSYLGRPHHTRRRIDIPHSCIRTTRYMPVTIGIYIIYPILNIQHIEWTSYLLCAFASSSSSFFPFSPSHFTSHCTASFSSRRS